MARILLRKIAAEVLGEDKARSIWSRLDIVGDIAIIKKPFDESITIGDLKRIAEEILRRLNYVKSVWLAYSPVEGPYKTRKFLHLAGEERSETLYREHGCVFVVDIRRVFITPRLNYEHVRIAKLVKPGETIINMFAGAGLFSIIIARLSNPRRIYSIDINPDAYHFMLKNIELNNVGDIVEPILGDAAEVIETHLRGVADRVLMPLPELALDYLPYAVEALRERGGIIHVYLHVTAPKGSDPLKTSQRLVGERLEMLDVRYRVLGARKVRPVGPRTLQTVVDVVVEK